jgi:cytochrome c oxidase cbb3-type subunit 3
MSSLCRRADRAWLSRLAGAGALLLIAGQPAAQPITSDVPASETGPLLAPATTLFPDHGKPPPIDPRAERYEGNPEAIGAGQRLFNWYNCAGCHFHGAGGMGPSLMDGEWIYGGRLDQIYQTIVQGRPNGMPSWGGKIPDNEIWEIAAYVKSLSAPNPANGAGQVMPTPPPPPAGPPH